MNNLFRHIEFLLLRHDCVIVPGLGAFIVTSIPACIDRETCRIVPPCRSVMFNQAVSLDDGLLANSYARSLSLSFEEARQVIIKDVAALFSSLQKSRSVALGRIGTLTLGEEDRLQFQPASNPIASARQLGFNSLSLPLADKVKTSAPDDNLLAGEATVQDKDNQDKDNKEYLHFKINRKIIKFTAVFTLMVILALAYIIYPTPKDSREQRASVVPVEVLLPAQKALPDEVSSVESIETIDEDLSVEQSDPLPVASEENAVPSYYLIVATFHAQKDADKFVSLYSNADCSLEIVPSRKVTRVSAASADNKEDLLHKMRDPQFVKLFPNSWIWESSY